METHARLVNMLYINPMKKEQNRLSHILPKIDYYEFNKSNFQYLFSDCAEFSLNDFSR
jgi:hypothetical protein